MTYPVSIETVRREVGTETIDLPDGSTTVSEALAGLQGGSFDSPDDVIDGLETMVGSEAVGREGYSDRSDPEAGESESPESF